MSIIPVNVNCLSKPNKKLGFNWTNSTGEKFKTQIYYVYSKPTINKIV